MTRRAGSAPGFSFGRACVRQPEPRLAHRLRRDRLHHTRRPSRFPALYRCRPRSFLSFIRRARHWWERQKIMRTPTAFIPIFCCLSLAVRAEISEVRATQIAFAFRSDGTTDTPRVLLNWTEINGSSESLDILRNGEVIGQLDGATEDGPRSFELSDEPLGEHVYEVVSSDGSAGEQVQTVIQSSPVGDTYNLTCTNEAADCSTSGDEESCEIIIIWENDGPFGGSYSVSVRDGASQEFVMNPISFCTTVVADSPGDHEVTIFAFADQSLSGEPGNYRSAIATTTCEFDCPETAKAYNLGVCDGDGRDPTLTSAVFGLNFLFLGGDEPPCHEACDVDRDGEFLLNDVVYVLNFLFLGGSPPVGWVDEDLDGVPDPTCDTAPRERCSEAHAGCF